MQFTKLRLLGFKSFVDPTELVIAPGLTGVVGPNGCGKSNLLEALRWVMGENRPTAMRGGGMEDVIFAGASSRPARNYAEVSLHLDNSERLAPPGFNDADALEIVRRITRDVGSAYKTNGKEARARDVQMLFADASTGAHSPALVRQGQIAELINAKPKARRRILEEAAGISGLYQRRHEAELKLRGAETNLARVEDVLESLQGQLNALAKQVRQAARYREIAEALRKADGRLLYRRWREAAEAHRAAAEVARQAVTAAAQAQGDAAKLTHVRAEAETKLPPLREEEAIAAAVLQRLLVERDTLADQEQRARDTIASLEARITQLTADMEREAGLNRDADEVIARLDWERQALDKASDGHEGLLAAARSEAEVAAGELEGAEAALDEATGDTARLAARHQAAERRLKEATALRDKARGAADTAAEAVTSAESELAGKTERNAEAQAAQKAAEEAATKADNTLISAENARGTAQAEEGTARAARAEAEGAETALSGEIAALERLLDRDRGDAPELLDEVRAAPGYEAALGAALGDDLKAPVVEGDAASGWVRVAADGGVPPLPGGAAALADHVDAPDVLSRRLQAVGVVDRADGPLLQSALKPGQRLVSREGDLWRWDGFRAGAEDAPSAAALRLQQLNRLEELRKSHAEAGSAADAARAAHAAQREAFEAAQAAEQTARRARKDAELALTEANRAAGRAEMDLTSLTSRLETLRAAQTARREEAAEASAAASEAERGLIDAAALEDAKDLVEARKLAVETARLTMIAKRTRADELRRDGEARARRTQEIAKEVGGWKKRLETAQGRMAEFERRMEESQAALSQAIANPEEITAKRADLASEIEKAEARRKSAADAVAAAETARQAAEAAERAAERTASEARETKARAEAQAEAAEDAVTAAAERIREETEETPDTLLERLDEDPDRIPPAAEIEIDIARLRRQRDALGAVNLRAEEDAAEVQSEFDTLNTEKQDLEAAVAKLRQGIANLNREGRQRLLAAFDDVNRNFTMLFRTLFGGGDANLVLVESDDPLEAGLEIMCQPPGKKLATLSLLSGGEQTLTALSLIFAVFLANPSPICVLDEVDAPLDDANVTRFCDLLDEMTNQTDTRFLIITHHAVTMARMDRLFGVTMAEQGVSQLVSVDLREAETLIDA